MGDKTKRRYKGVDFDHAEYKAALQRRAAVAPAQPKRNLIAASTIARLAGCAVTTPGRLAKSNMLPEPCAYDDHGMPLWDADDKRLKEWIEAMQRGQRK